MKELIEGLKTIEKELEEFVSPGNKQGLYKHFVFWVYTAWSKNKFYKTNIVDVDYDRSSYPNPTGKLRA